MIDDEDLLTRTFSLLLEKSGYETFAARSGMDAEVMVEEEDFDFIICDIRMPGINGVEAMKRVQEYSKTHRDKQVPLIFITGYADAAIEQEARTLQPLAYLRKPFDNGELLEVIKKKLG